MAGALPTSTPPRGVLCSRLTRGQEVFLLVLLAVAVRLIGFNAPYIDGHWIKQLQVAPIAKNFYLHGYNLLWPQADYSADRPNYIEIEFQLVTFLTAMLWHVFGVHEWVGRLVTVGFSLGGMLLLWRLLARYLGEGAAEWGLLFYAFAPSSWYYSRALMSEPAMMFFSVGVVYCFSRYLGASPPTPSPGRGGGGNQAAWFLLTAACGMLAFLVKLPTVLLLLPLAYLAWDKWGWGFLRRGAVWALVVVTLAPALAYYWHAHHAIGSHYFSVGVGPSGGMWFAVKDFTRPGNYSQIMMQMLRDHLTAVGMVLLPVGVFLRPTLGVAQASKPASARSGAETQAWKPALPGSAPYLFHFWLGAVAVYFIVVAGGILRQTYYEMPLLLPAAGLIGVAWERLVRTGVVTRWGNGVLVALFLVSCAWGVQPFFKPYTPILQASAALDQVDPAGRPVIIFPPGYGCLYYFHRPGWVGREAMDRPQSLVAPEDMPGPLYVTNRISRGARWAVYFTSNRPSAREDLESYLRTTYRRIAVGAGDSYELFDLSAPASSPPPCPPVGSRNADE